MRKVKELNFSGQSIFCGLDIHKKSWQVNIRTEDFELEHFSQPPCAEMLVRHLMNRYPGASYRIVYEAGFCGFSVQRSLKQAGLDCILVNPADVPSSDKEKKRKQDRIDARKLGRQLAAGSLTGIYIPSIELEHARSLVRQRSRLVWDQTRCKNRIWHLLMFSGLQLEADTYYSYWSRRFITALQLLPCPTVALKQTLNLAIEEYLQVRKLLGEASRQIRMLSTQADIASILNILLSIPGIGMVNAMIIITELQDMKRFETLDLLCSYVGIVPDTASSGETQRVKGITYRSNHYLRPAIVESSWTIIRKDPAMLMFYSKYCKRMEPNKAIIKIARHLLSRIRYLWNTGLTYECAIVG
jgi:transposase